MNAIDEWIDSDGAKRDALKFKNGCYISGRRCGKTAFALSQIEQYLKDHPDAKIAIPDRHGYSYYKKLINSVYGRKKSQHDDMPDAISYALKEFGIKQREKMLKQSELTNEWLKRMLNNSHYGVCWPSELIDSCERIDKYKEEETNNMADQKEVYTFTTKDFKGDRYEITIEKSFGNKDYPYHARLYSLNDFGGANFVRTFGYRFWEHLETQFMYDLAANGVVICTECRDELTSELERARHGFGGRGLSYSISYANCKSTNEKKDEVRYTAPFNAMPKIEKVIFNPPATIVKWKDGTKTIVKCQDDDDFDWEKGLAMAYVKRAFNNERTYYGLFKKNEPLMNLPNSNMRYNPKIAKEVRIIVPKDLPVTGDIIMKAYELIMKECNKKAENGIELDR